MARRKVEDAKASVEERAMSEETGAITAAELAAEVERLAARDRPPFDEAKARVEEIAKARETLIARQQDEAIAKAREKLKDDLAKEPFVASVRQVDPTSEVGGLEIDACWAEEMYGKQGSFSSYRVGPFRTKDRVRPGETRAAAFARVMAELEVVAKAERIRARDAFVAHFPVAFEPAAK